VIVKKILLLVGLCSFNLVQAQNQSTPTLQLSRQRAGSVEAIVSGINHLNNAESSWSDSLQVFVQGSTIPISGTCSVTGNNLYFAPDFPFEEGIGYRFNYFGKDTLIVIPETKKKAALVIQIYPTTDQIPENLLRFYIYFNSPMRDGNFLDYIHLLDEEGNDLKGVFFDNQYELWSENFTRLTILVDPGRVKTGLRANVQLGRAFQKGKRYKLVIDKNWKTLGGQTLAKNYVKEFYGAEADLIAPDKELWNVTAPEANSKKPLIIRFGQSIDHVSARKFMNITDHSQALIAGELKLENDDSVMRFYPNKKWQDGKYQILINSRLEDIVGNNLNGLFDHQSGTLKNQQEGIIARLHFNTGKLCTGQP